MPISSALGIGALLPGSLGFRNKIINGNMVIAQRGTAAVTSGYPVDRWAIGWSAASTPSFVQSTSITPNGYRYSVAATISTGAAVNSGVGNIQQNIEGYNIADVGFGTAWAKRLTLSFWVRASIAGVYCVGFRNGNSDRSYVAEYSISSANTWEYKTITLTADTTGTWDSTSGKGLALLFSIAGCTINTSAGVWIAGNFIVSPNQTHLAGTTGATFYITGVQLEANYQPTPFEQRPIGTELALCQRYYQRVISGAELTTQAIALGQAYGTTVARCVMRLPTTMRGLPTVFSSSASHFSLSGANGGYTTAGSLAFGEISSGGFYIDVTLGSAALVAGNATWVRVSSASGYIEAVAEL